MLDPAEQEPIAADDAEIDAVLAEFGVIRAKQSPRCCMT